jgi:hypothetical protein
MSLLLKIGSTTNQTSKTTRSLSATLSKYNTLIIASKKENKTDGSKQGPWRAGGEGVAFLLDFFVRF